MKHPHHDMISEWIKDTSRPVDYRPPGGIVWSRVTGAVNWLPDFEYRFAPEPKPDVVRHLVRNESYGNWSEYTPQGWEEQILRITHDKQILRITRDGETGKLKSVEIVK